MTCDKNACKCDQTEALKAQVVGFGFDPSYIADLIQKFGPDLLGIVVEAVRQGLSVATIKDIVEKFGPDVLNLLLGVLNNKSAKAFAGDQGVVIPGGVVVADQAGGLIDIILQNFLPQVLQKLLPVLVQQLPQLLQQYGPQLLQLLTSLIQQLVTPPAPQK